MKMGYENEAAEVMAKMEQKAKKPAKKLRNIQVLIGRLTFLDERGYDINDFAGWDEKDNDQGWSSIRPGTKLEIQITNEKTHEARS
jgi:maleate cis-trans isomerase